MSIEVDFPNKRFAYFRNYSPLIFTFFYFIHPIVEPPGPKILSLLIVVYFVQVWLYHLMVSSENRGLIFLCILSSIGLSVATSGENQSAYTFYWFCAYFAALRFPLRYALITLALILSAIAFCAIYFEYNHPWYYLSVIIPSFGLFFYGLYDGLERRHLAAQAKSQEEVEQLAQVAERERIARDLHDVMGHSLISIALKAQLADKLAKNGQTNEALKEISEVAAVSSETLAQMRSVVSGYKAKSLDSLIKNLVESLEKWHFKVEEDLTIPELNAQQESTLSLVLTEAITNIIKHCKGSRVSLNTESPVQAYPDAAWALHIHDNGHVETMKPGNGLAGMRERLAQINADLKVSWSEGMHLTLLFPQK